MWSKQEIEDHKNAACLLIKIKDLTFNHIKKNPLISEYDIQQFILKKFNEFKLQTDKDPPIVAFNENSAIPEFYPKKKSKIIRENTFILIDLWGKLKKEKAPFADITWTAYYGKKIPTKILEVFKIVIGARNIALDYIKNQLKEKKIPTGKKIDDLVCNIIANAGYKQYILHETGHSLGFIQDHGPKPNWLYQNNKKKLHRNLGYTIEPGIYLKNKFGVRSEINFYISDKNEVIATTDLQNKIILL